MYTRVSEKYIPGMIVHIPPGKFEEEIERIREEKRAILKKFGHGDVEPIVWDWGSWPIMSRVVEKYKPGMIVRIPPEESKKRQREIFEEKLAILKKFGHGDFEPELRKQFKLDD